MLIERRCKRNCQWTFGPHLSRLSWEQLLQAIMDIRAQLAFLQPGLGQSDYQVSVARADLIPFRSFHLANHGGKLSVCDDARDDD